MILTIEEHPGGWAPEFMFEGYNQGQIQYHAYLSVDSGLALGSDVTTFASDGPAYIIRALTSAGHEFAESARNEFIWDEVQAEIKDKGFTSAALDVIKRLLDRQIKKRLGLE